MRDITKDYFISLIITTVICSAIYLSLSIKTSSNNNGFSNDTLGFKYWSKSLDESIENGWYKCSYILDTNKLISNTTFFLDSLLWCEQSIVRYRRGFKTDNQRIYVGDSLGEGLVVNSTKLIHQDSLKYNFRWLNMAQDTIGQGHKWNQSYNILSSTPDTLLVEIEGNVFTYKGELWLAKEL